MRQLESASETPILIVTGLNDEETIQTAFKAGATDFLNKPVCWPVLRNRVGRLLHMSQTQRALRWQTEALSRSENLLRAATEGSLNAFFILQALRDNAGQLTDFVFLDLNGVAEQTLGRPKKDLIGQLLCETYPANRTTGLFNHYAQVVETGQSFQSEICLQTPDLKGKWLRVQAVPLLEYDGVAVTTEDITERKNNEARLAESEELNRVIVSALEEGVLMVDRAGSIMTINDSACRTLGYEAPELLEGKKLSKLYSKFKVVNEDGLPLAPEQFPLIVSLRTGISQLNVILGENEGGVITRWLSVTSHPLFRAGEKEPYAGVVSFADITERHKVEEQLSQQALYDSLTGLPNRTNLNRRLEQTIIQAKEQSSVFSVVYLDLDGFKAINDQLGHAAGDLLLKEVARRLQACVRKQDTVARLGGDEFVLLLPGIQNADYARQVGQNILNTLNNPYMLDGRPAQVSASLGFSLYPHTAQDSHNLLQQADQAMYWAKESGKNTCRMYGFMPHLHSQTSLQQTA